ncbi:hypothetical protein NDU88_004910 [Pleurodeles waltl]|uniref:Reverse transcriptase domain-containing protein n=1 Tax=Pleurodeles waltl TaxID=8319 RepID=A0AAV7QHF3_PLEWA|nr:hypothetical protein NDU88_004910 [Pleurodeles waltl]
MLVDLTKAVDNVNPEGLWRIMEKFGYPGKFISMVHQFHDCMLARVLDDGDSSDTFPVTNRVKEGCALARTLFSMMFLAMLSDAFCDDEETSSKIINRTDGRLFNMCRVQAKTMVEGDSVRDFLFTDDCALNSVTEAQMQRSRNCYSTACKNFGQSVPRRLKSYISPHRKRRIVDKFTYLSSTLSRSVKVDNEVDTCITKAGFAFGWLRESVWERRGIKLSTKLKMYKTVVVPTLLCACETWTVYERHAKKLNRFHMNCLRRLLKITWQNKVPDKDVLSQTGLPSIYTLLRRAQVRWEGQLVCMPETRLPKRLCYGELAEGKQTQGEQKKSFKDMLKVSLKNFGIELDSWETLTHNHPTG